MNTFLTRWSVLTARRGHKYNYKRIKVPKYKKRYKKMTKMYTSLNRLSVLTTRTGQKYKIIKVPKYKKRKVQQEDKDDLLFDQMAGFYKQSFKSFWNQATFY